MVIESGRIGASRGKEGMGWGARVGCRGGPCVEQVDQDGKVVGALGGWGSMSLIREVALSFSY